MSDFGKPVIEYFKIPDGATTTGWEGRPCYESGDNEATLITDASEQLPVGVIADVDTLSGRLAVCTHGLVPGGAVPGAAVDLSAQRTNFGNYAGANDAGKVIGATAGVYQLGRWVSEGLDPALDVRQPFFVDISLTKFVAPE